MVKFFFVKIFVLIIEFIKLYNCSYFEESSQLVKDCGKIYEDSALVSGGRSSKRTETPW